MASIEVPLRKMIRGKFTVWFYLIKVLPFEWFYKLIENKPMFKVKFKGYSDFAITAREARYGA